MFICCLDYVYVICLMLRDIERSTEMNVRTRVNLWNVNQKTKEKKETYSLYKKNLWSHSFFLFHFIKCESTKRNKHSTNSRRNKWKTEKKNRNLTYLVCCVYKTWNKKWTKIQRKYSGKVDNIENSRYYKENEETKKSTIILSKIL